MLNEGNPIHNFISSSGSGTVINYDSGSTTLAGSSAFITRGPWIQNRFFPDPGSRISDLKSQTHILEIQS
jgi:hypothetical protein